MNNIPTVTFGILSVAKHSCHNFMMQKLSQPNPYYNIKIDSPRIQAMLDQGCPLDTEESYIFVNDLLIHLDNRDNPQWNAYERRENMLPYLNAIIKTQFVPEQMHSIDMPNFPFIFSGPNDITAHTRKFTPGETMPLMDAQKYRQQFDQTAESKSFEFSIYARWGLKRRAFWKNRIKFMDSSEHIPNSRVLQAYGSYRDPLGNKIHIDNYIHTDTYWGELSRSQFGLSSNGRGPWCVRDMEIAAIGAPIFREKVPAIMFKPFVAGTHFIEVSPESLSDACAYYTEHYDEALQIGQNARNYFDAYHQPDGMRRLFREIIDKVLVHYSSS